MTDETVQQTQEDIGPAPENSEQQKFDADYVRKLRDEAAKYRTQLREAQKELTSLKPAAEKLREIEESQKTEQQKMAERLAALESELQKKAQEAERRAAEAQVIRLAAKAGIDPDVAMLLDISKIDIEDEEKALAILSKLAGPRATGGNAANPGKGTGSQPSDEELRALYFGQRTKTTIFGG